MPGATRKSTPKVTHEEKVTPLEDGYVFIEKGFTVKTGDYESTRVTIGVKSPVSPSDDFIVELKRTIRKIDAIVDTEAAKQLEAIDDETADIKHKSRRK